MAYEIFDFPGALSPRRVIIYLAEKNLLSRPLIKITPVTLLGRQMSAPGKPPGTVPILAFGDGEFIKQSIAIMDYFEDICDATRSVDAKAELSEIERQIGEAGGKNMRGETAREILGLADEATAHFGAACRKVSKMFSSTLEEQHRVSSRFALDACKKALGLIEVYYEDDHRFGDGENGEGRVMIGDCVAFSLFQFAKGLYGVDLTEGLPNLRRFYEEFSRRESAILRRKFYNDELKALASSFIQEDQAD